MCILYKIVWFGQQKVEENSVASELSVVHVETCSLAFESVFDKVQGCLAGRRQQPVRASLRASCAARPSSPPSTRCAREELDEINVFVNVFDKVAPEKPVLANAVAVAALNKTRARSLTRSTCSSPTSSTRPEKLDKVQGCLAGRQQPVRASLRQAVRPGLRVRLRQGARARNLTRSTSS